MATKRKFQLDSEKDHQEMHVSSKKHTLDSDEEDSDDYEKDNLNDSDIEGEEEGVAKTQDEVKITPFNMREELQEGHFDKEGHYHWNKDTEIKDNWLDDIDWVKVKDSKNFVEADRKDEQTESRTEPGEFNQTQAYADLLKFMEPNETIQKTLQRLGKGRAKITSAERLRLKKFCIVDEVVDKITKFTELTNEILIRTGNMDIYQETYEHIKSRVIRLSTTSQAAQNSCDMYADDFEEKEKEHLDTVNSVVQSAQNELSWEFKWKNDDSKPHGPYSTEQMLKWSQEKYFKNGVYVRKVGEATNFYSSNRIDFDLYL